MRLTSLTGCQTPAGSVSLHVDAPVPASVVVPSLTGLPGQGKLVGPNPAANGASSEQRTGCGGHYLPEEGYHPGVPSRPTPVHNILSSLHGREDVTETDALERTAAERERPGDRRDAWPVRSGVVL